MSPTELSAELKELIDQFDIIRIACLIDHGKKSLFPKDYDFTPFEKVSGRQLYSQWFERSRRIIVSIANDRWDEFSRLYIPTSNRKDIDYKLYTISDYFAGTSVKFGGQDTFDKDSRFDALIRLQLDILNGIHVRAKRRFQTLRSELAYSLQTDELTQASTLLKGGHTRAAGALAGVVLEGHLKEVCLARGIKITGKETLSPLNDKLKDAEVLSQADWRKVQYLGDIRNKCAHRGTDEPKAEEVKELIDEVRKFLSMVN